MNIKLFGATALIFLWQSAIAQAPNVLLIEPQHFVQKKADFKRGLVEEVKAVGEVVKLAAEALNGAPASVMQKAFTPPSGSKHDYMSMAPYFWPDSSKPGGLPYIRKDGQRNPEIRKITDHELLSDLELKCKYLSLTYYFTGDDRYAARADELLRIWFLDTATRMNPNLNYAQAIRGVNDGRGIGIIETRCLANLADWIVLLRGSKSFPSTHNDALVAWYKEYLNWLLTSKNGRDEHNAKNNHGTHYDVQVVDFALFTGQKELAAHILSESKTRIAVQLEPDGRQPLELERTNALSYSSMNLDGWINLALLGDAAGVDLWSYSTADGRSIRKAVDWLLPFALGDAKFSYQQISPYGKDELYRVLLLCAEKSRDSKYAQAADRMREPGKNYLEDLLYK